MKKQLAKLLIKRLENDGFTFHRRYCEQSSHYGQIDEEGMFKPDVDKVAEDWRNREFINWLLNVDDKEISNEAEELDKLLKQ